MQFNWVDLLIIGTLVFFSIESLGRPIILELFDFASFFLSGLLSFSYYNLPARFMENQFKIPHGLSLVLGFMAIWFLSEVLFFFLARILLPGIPRYRLLGSRVLSVIPALLRGLIFIALTLVILATFPVQPAIKRDILDSKLGSQILRVAYRLESPVKKVFGGAANDSLTFLTIKPKTNEKVDLGFQTSQISIDESSEKVMFNLVNQERVMQDIKPLEFNSRLRDIARSHSADMFKRGYFSHYSPEDLTVADRALKEGVDFLVIGENLAYAPGVESAHRGLMNSEGHRANILSTDYKKIGLGIMDGGIYGKMFTQVFSN